MDLRKQRALQILATAKLRRSRGKWVVPSHTTSGSYRVEIGDEEAGRRATCTCPDAEGTWDCKHVLAVKLHLAGAWVGEPPEVVRPTYGQDWKAYNKAQINEKRHVLSFLHELCSGIREPLRERGRPPAPLRDVVFCAAMKGYTGFSGRRFMTDVENYQRDGLVSAAVHYNTISKYLQRAELTPLLEALVREAASPLQPVETTFAIDASGFSTCVYQSYNGEKWGGGRKLRDWVKVHIMCGTKSNVVVGIRIIDRGDATQFPELMMQAANGGYRIEEISADKAYVSHANFAVAQHHGAVPYIPFRSNMTGVGTDLWRRIYHLYHYRLAEFRKHYHRRSNVESVFSMVKRKFGVALRSKDDTAQTNELLLRFLLHNLCCVVASIYELGIEPEFGATH